MKRRRRIIISVGLIVGFLAAIAGGLAALAKREPKFYTDAELPAGRQRETQSAIAIARTTQIKNAINDDPEWQVSYSAEQINSYFQENFLMVGSDSTIPENFSAPRVQMDEGRIRIGVRYRTGFWSTILSIELKPWLVPGETNLVGLEIVSLKAGSLPISTSTVIDYISQLARRQNTDVTWYRNEGHPVAVLRYQADQARPTLILQQLEFTKEGMTLVGRANDVMGSSGVSTPVPKK